MIEQRNPELLATKAYKLAADELFGSFLKEDASIRIGRRIGRYCYHISSHVLRKQSKKCQSMEDAVKLAFNFRFLGITIKPLQVRQEITDLLRILNEAKPRVILEIGTACGGTLFLFARVAPPDAIIISLDLQDEDGFYPTWRANLYKSFSSGGQSLHLLRADSHSINTVRKVQNVLGSYKIDFLFIDGDHSYEGVKKDFEMYSPLVRNGGIIAFHDIVPGPLEYVGGVPTFWTEIKPKFKHVEYINDMNQKGFGIGVLYV